MAKRKKKFKARVRPFGDYKPFTEAVFLKDLDKVEKDWSRKRYGITFILIGFLLLFIVGLGVYDHDFIPMIPIGKSLPDNGQEIPDGYKRLTIRVYEKINFEFANYDGSHLESKLVRVYNLGVLKYLPTSILFVIGASHFLPERKKENDG